MESDPIIYNRVVDEPMQSLLTKAKTAIGLNEGAHTMFFANVPNAAPTMPAMILVAQKATPQQRATMREHILGICELLNRNRGSGSQAQLYPVSTANLYFAIGRKTNTIPQPPKIQDNAKISVLQKPKHGKVEPTHLDGRWSDTRYVPNADYEGDDATVLLVEGNGYKVKIFYYFTVTNSDGLDIRDNPNCAKSPEDGSGWKISSLPTDTISLASLQRNNDLSTIIASASEALTNFTNLPGTAVGETVGTGNTATITLDTNANINGVRLH